MAQPLKARTSACSGFTLVELAIVVAIIALLLGSLLVTVSGQIEVQRAGETRETLTRVRDALIGFAAANRRLPCPATASSNGIESPAGGGACTGSSSGVVHGFVPGVTLGITPTDASGYVIDGWGGRLRYAVHTGSVGGQNDVFTTTDRMKSVGMGPIGDPGSNALLYVCSTSTGIVSSVCASGATLSSKAPAVVYSLGKNGTSTSGSDEAENLDADRAFVAHDLAGGGATGAFDDTVTWISVPVLFNRMIAAGQLP